MDEFLFLLGSVNGIEQYFQVAACRVLHPGWVIDSAGNETVLLVLNGARADCVVADKIINKIQVFRVQHFVGCRQACFCDDAVVQAAHSSDSLDQVALSGRILFMQQAFVAIAGRTRFVCVDTGNHEHFVFDLFLQFRQTTHIFHYRFFIVGGTRSDDQKDAIVFAFNDVVQLFIACCLHRCLLRRQLG